MVHQVDEIANQSQQKSESLTGTIITGQLQVLSDAALAVI